LSLVLVLYNEFKIRTDSTIGHGKRINGNLGYVKFVSQSELNLFPQFKAKIFPAGFL